MREDLKDTETSLSNIIKTEHSKITKEAKLFGSKICEWKEYNRKDEWINSVGKELQGFKEGHEVIKHLESLKAALEKKYPIG